MIFYLLGVFAAGFFESSLFMIPKYKEFYMNEIDDTIGGLTIEEQELCKDIDPNSIITTHIVFTSLFSWLGLIYSILSLGLMLIRKIC